MGALTAAPFSIAPPMMEVHFVPLGDDAEYQVESPLSPYNNEAFFLVVTPPPYKYDSLDATSFDLTLVFTPLAPSVVHGEGAGRARSFGFDGSFQPQRPRALVSFLNDVRERAVGDGAAGGGGGGVVSMPERRAAGLQIAAAAASSFTCAPMLHQGACTGS